MMCRQIIDAGSVPPMFWPTGQTAGLLHRQPVDARVHWERVAKTPIAQRDDV